MFLLLSVAEQAGYNLTWSQTKGTFFLVMIDTQVKEDLLVIAYMYVHCICDNYGISPDTLGSYVKLRILASG